MTNEATLPAQRRKLGKGMTLTFIGFLLCWVPGLGALLSLIGFFKIVSSYTPGNRVLRSFYILLGLLFTLASVGALVTMLYVYFARPDILTQAKEWIINFLSTSGQKLGISK